MPTLDVMGPELSSALSRGVVAECRVDARAMTEAIVWKKSASSIRLKCQERSQDGECHIKQFRGHWVRSGRYDQWYP